jgi:hypothetical protein
MGHIASDAGRFFRIWIYAVGGVMCIAVRKAPRSKRAATALAAFRAAFGRPDPEKSRIPLAIIALRTVSSYAPQYRRPRYSEDRARGAESLAWCTVNHELHVKGTIGKIEKIKNAETWLEFVGEKNGIFGPNAEGQDGSRVA